MEYTVIPYKHPLYYTDYIGLEIGDHLQKYNNFSLHKKASDDVIVILAIHLFKCNSKLKFCH